MLHWHKFNRSRVMRRKNLIEPTFPVVVAIHNNLKINMKNHESNSTRNMASPAVAQDSLTSAADLSVHDTGGPCQSAAPELKTAKKASLSSERFGCRLAFSVKEAAEILGVSEKTIRRLVARGLLRSSKALRHLLIPKKEIERFLETTTA